MKDDVPVSDERLRELADGNIAVTASGAEHLACFRELLAAREDAAARALAALRAWGACAVSDRTDDVQDWIDAIRAVGYGPELEQGANMAEELAQARATIARLEAQLSAWHAHCGSSQLDHVPRHDEVARERDQARYAIAQARADACEEVAQALEAAEPLHHGGSRKTGYQQAASIARQAGRGTEKPKSGCGYRGHAFGAAYVDGVCIGGWLWDLDSCSEPGGELLVGGDDPCPSCNRVAFLERVIEATEEDIVVVGGSQMEPIADRLERIRKDLPR